MGNTIDSGLVTTTTSTSIEYDTLTLSCVSGCAQRCCRLCFSVGTQDVIGADDNEALSEVGVESLGYCPFWNDYSRLCRLIVANVLLRDSALMVDVR